MQQGVDLEIAPKSTSAVGDGLDFARREMPRFLPWLTLALFAGVRPEEADKLTWQSIDLDRSGTAERELEALHQRIGPGREIEWPTRPSEFVFDLQAYQEAVKKAL